MPHQLGPAQASGTTFIAFYGYQSGYVAFCISSHLLSTPYKKNSF
jgi:hypothetical protein